MSAAVALMLSATLLPRGYLAPSWRTSIGRPFVIYMKAEAAVASCLNCSQRRRRRVTPRKMSGPPRALLMIILAFATDRLRVIDERVRLEVARVLGLPDPQSIDPSQSLFELGLDSLMAIELRRRLGELQARRFLPHLFSIIPMYRP